MKFQPNKIIAICLSLLWSGTFGGLRGGIIGQDSKPLVISNFRRIEPNHFGDQFAWGNNSQLFYIRHHPSGAFIYLKDLATNQTNLITKGTSPAFLNFDNHDSICFLRRTGYSDEREIWLFSIYPKTGVQGEHKFSGAVLRIQDNIHLNPDDSHSFAYRFSCDRADGYFEQIRLSQVKDYEDPFLRTSVLYSRPMGGMMPSISGWLDKDTVLCFLGEEPYRLKVSSKVILPENQSNPRDYNADHYPEDESGLLVQGLEGKVVLPRSNISPDGNSYLVYSPKREAILQKNIYGKELSATMLPDSVKYKDFHPKHPIFSPDGQHIAFIGLAKTSGRDQRTIYLADVN